MSNNQLTPKQSKGCAVGCLSVIGLIVILIMSSIFGGESVADVNYDDMNVENVTNAINNVLGDMTDEDKVRVIKVEFSGNYLNAYINADSVMDARLTLYDSNDLFEELRKFKQAEQINLRWYNTAIDSYGQKSDTMTVHVALKRAELDKIAFENFPIENYKTLAFTYFVHPSWQW